MAVSSRRRITALVITLAAVALVTLPWALFTSRADLTFGPHEAQYRITADSRLTVDFGPLGKVLVPTEDVIPLGLGVHVDIGEIPVSGESADDERPAADPDAVADPGGGSVDALVKYGHGDQRELGREERRERARAIPLALPVL